MNVLNLNGDIFDLDQIVSTEVQASCVRVRFRNGDEIPVYWRDDQERSAVLKAISPLAAKAPELSS